MLKRCVLLVLCCYSSVSLAFGWNDLWFNKFHQGVKHYREKDYQAATDLFSQSDNAQSNYNRGNALAFSKKYQEAIQAYDKALKLNPSMADAKYNREIIKKLLEQQKKQQKDQEKDKKKQKQSESKKQKEQDKKKQGQKDDKQKSGQQKQKDQQKQEKQQAKAKKQESKKQNKAPQPAQKTAQQKRQARKNREKDQSEKQLLNNIPDDPGGLLRRKFQRDYERRQMEAKGW